MRPQGDRLGLWFLMSRPYSISPEERNQQDFDSYREQYLQAREDAGAVVMDPYAT